jgi:hypothetical protein
MNTHSTRRIFPRVCEDAQYGCIKLRGNLHPLLDVRHICSAFRFIGHGKVVAHAGTADAHARFKCVELKFIEIFVGGQFFRIAGGKIPCGIKAVNIVFGTEINNVIQVHPLATVFDLCVEQFSERICVD